MRKVSFFTVGVLVAITSIHHSAWSRPVSYPGGWTSMIMNNSNRNSLHVHYSPAVKYSLGYRLEYWRDKEYAIHAVQMNYLLKRWNGPDSQANLYLKSGLGVAAHSDSGFLGHNRLQSAFFVEIATDWEDRRFFVSYKSRYTVAESIDNFYMQSARVGMAPYVGNYGDLHVWFMFQLDHQPEDDDPIIVTPIVRFFKAVHMVEVGVSHQGNILFNWVARY